MPFSVHPPPAAPWIRRAHGFTDRVAHLPGDRLAGLVHRMSSPRISEHRQGRILLGLLLLRASHVKPTPVGTRSHVPGSGVVIVQSATPASPNHCGPKIESCGP